MRDEWKLRFAGASLLSLGLASCVGGRASSDAGTAEDAGIDAGVDAGSVIPKGSRVLALDILTTTPASSFGDNLALARSIGAGAISFPYDWNQIEPDTPLDCDAGSAYLDPVGAFAAFEGLLPDAGLSLTLSLRVINTNSLDVPASLQARAFDGVPGDTSLVACRFERLLDHVFEQIPGITLVSLQIGNEIDSYAGAANAGFWNSYQSFFGEVAAYARAKRPGLKVGVTATFGGLTGQGGSVAKNGLAALNQLADLVGVTYYPITASYQVQDPGAVAGDFRAMVASCPTGVPLYVEEAGYPSAPLCGSSPAAQAGFIDALFAAWDSNAGRVPFVNIVRLVDLSDADAAADAALYFSSPPAAFVAYLETLGLEQYDGGVKPGLVELQRQTATRRW